MIDSPSQRQSASGGGRQRGLCKKEQLPAFLFREPHGSMTSLLHPPPHKTTTVSASSQSLSAGAILPLWGCNLAKPSSGPRTWQPKGSTHQPASRSASPRAQEGRPRFFSMWGRTSCLLGCSYRQGHLVYGIQAPFPLLPSQGWRGAVSICSGGCVSCLAPWHCQEERSGRSEGLCLTIDSGPGSAPPLPASTKFTEAIGSQQEQGAGPQQNRVA